MLKKRVITVLWALPLLIAAIWFDKPVPWFTVLMAIWGLAAVYEFYTISKTTNALPLTIFGLIWTLLFIISPHFNYYPLVLPLLLALSVIISLIILLLLPKKAAAFMSWAWAIVGILYIGLLLSYFVALRGVFDGRSWVLLALLIVFATDTTAFFIGRAWGKRRLAPSISPGKTWEGAIAGIFGAIIASIVLVFLLNLPLSYGQAILLGLLVSIFGQLGDLAESLLKRNFGVKDSGKLMPGHGGLLDRTDSVVFAGVVVYYFVIAFRSGWLNWLA